MRSVAMSEEPKPHVLRIEQHGKLDATSPLYGGHVSLFLDDTPLSNVRSVDIRYAYDELVTATICMELRGVEIPEGAAVIKIERIGD
jgi:hypothetical protein